jgi:general secretion pathway protein G
VQTASRGFTLIEIMIVVVILGVLGGLVVPSLFPKIDAAKIQITKSNLLVIRNSLLVFKMDNRHFPSTDQGLQALVAEPDGFPAARRWDPGGYMDKVPLDPWDEPYSYSHENGSVEVTSYGADRTSGGTGVGSDIRLSDL